MNTGRTIDELMSLDPLEMAPKDIDDIIAYHRQNRANAADGPRPKKEKGPTRTTSLEALGLAKPKPTIVRRI